MQISIVSIHRKSVLELTTGSKLVIRRQRRLTLAAFCFAIIGWLTVASLLAEEPQVLREHTESVFGLTFSPRDEMLVSGSGDDTIKFWQLTAPKPNPRSEQLREKWLDDLDSDQFDVRQQAFANLAAEGHLVSDILRERLESTKSTEVRLRIRYLMAALIVPPGVGHQADVRSVVFSPDGKYVASGGRDNLLHMWRVSSRRATSVIRTHSDGIWSLAFSPDATMLASGGGDHHIRLWHHRSGTMATVLEGHDSTVQDLAFSPDGMTLASAGGFDRSVRLWDVATGKEIDSIEKHADAVLRVAYSPDGKQLVTAGYDGVVQLWRSEDLQHLREIPAGGQVIRAVGYAVQGKLLITAGDDRLIRIYDPTNGTLLATWKGHRDGIQALAVAHSGLQVATGSRDGEIRLWNLTQITADDR